MKFGISNNVRSRVVRECTPELFHQVTESKQVEDVCAEIADALEKVKRGEMSRDDFDSFKNERKKALPIFTPHATFKNGRRLNADAVPSGMSMYDIDHISDPRGYFETNVKARVDELGVVLAHVTPSAEGLRLFFIVPQGMSLAEAQRWMSEQLGDKTYDQSVKDYARSSFVVPTGYIMYVDEGKMFTSPDRQWSLAPLRFPHRGTETQGGECLAELDKMSGSATCRGNGSALPHDETTHVGLAIGMVDSDGAIDGGKAEPLPLRKSSCYDVPGGDGIGEAAFKGMPYADIIGEWFRLAGGEPAKGERNDKLHRLASHLRYITDNDERLLLDIMPRFGLDETEMRALIHSACSAKFYSMPKMMVKAVDNVRRAGSFAGTGDGADENADKAGRSCPPAMPRKLPGLIKLLVSRTPNLYKPAVAQAVFPSLATHLWRVRFRYIDNVEHEATLMNVLMAGTGAGKDCISAPINHIMADIRTRDEANLRREREWKQEVTAKGANKDKRQRPEGLVIQEIDADMTNPAFVMRTAEADGHFLYTKMNEIDQFDALRGSGRGTQQFQIMCLAFDPGNRYGQTRVGAQSVTEKVTIRFNWNAATTIQKGKRYFSRVLTDGPISRINFCTIPEREIGADMPVYGTYDAAFEEELRPYIENLNRATGVIDCPQAFKLAMKMKDENAEFARLSQSRVYENLSFRANVIAWLKACVLYVANGNRWDKTLEDFVRWSLKYDMWCKMQFFGDAIEEAGQESKDNRTRGPQNLLELLPDSFTTADAMRVRQSMDMDVKGTRNMLYQWAHRGYVLHLTDDSYKKVEKE
jgi:hypothetical protein